MGRTSQDRWHMFRQKWHFDEPPLGDAHTKMIFWWTYPRGFSHFSSITEILMNLPSGISTLSTQNWDFDEHPLGDFHTFHAELRFRWTSPRAFSHFSHRAEIFHEPTLGHFHTFHSKKMIAKPSKKEHSSSFLTQQTHNRSYIKINICLQLTF